MWISKKEYASMQKKIADLEKQVKYQQLTIEMCKKVDTTALELRNEFQSSRNSSSLSGSIR